MEKSAFFSFLLNVLFLGGPVLLNPDLDGKLPSVLAVSNTQSEARHRFSSSLLVNR